MWARLQSRYRSVKARLRFGQSLAVFGPFYVGNRRNVHFGRNVAINHDTFILGRNQITIEDDVVLSARCMILDGGLDPTERFTSERRSYREAPVTIRRGAWIGAGAIILPGVTVGEFAVVGAGSVVTRDVPPKTIFAGNPAKQIGKISD